MGELNTSNPGAEVLRVPPKVPNVSARRADDANMGDEVAQRDISDAECISGAEIRDLRRRNSPSDPASREIEDHVLTEHARSGHGVQLVCKGEVEPRDTKEKVTRNLRMAQRSQSCRWITASLELRSRVSEAEVEQRGGQSGCGDAQWCHQVDVCSFDFCERS